MTMAPQRRTISSNSGNRTYNWASTAIDQNDRSGLGAPTRFCISRPLTTTDFASGAPCPGGGTTSHATARLKTRAAQYGGRMRRARRARKPGDRVEPPAVAGRRQGQREAGQHDEDDDREPPVDEPAGPERCPVHRVAGECAQEDVVHHHEQRGQAPDAVQAGQPLPRRTGDCRHAARRSLVTSRMR